VLALVTWLVAAAALVPQLQQRSVQRHGLLCVAVIGVGVGLGPLVSPRQLTELVEAPLPGLVLDGLRTATDVDGDGYSALLGGGDCAPFDGQVHPGAYEAPDNGRDDNCSLGDVTAAQVSLPDEVEIPTAPATTSVVLITVDTLRADRMGVYGHSRDTTPRIDAWAKQALVFDKAFTSGGWTSIAVSSMFHGLYPRRMSWTRLIETSRFRLLRAPEKPKKGERIRASFAMPLDDEHKPLAWWLRRRNMYTTAVVNDGHSQFLSPKFGCAEGFDQYRTLDSVSPSKRDDKHTTQLAIEALKQAPEDRPFFLWVHYFGPHDPTTSHPGVESFGSALIDRYDHEIRAADLAVGQLLDVITSLRQKREIAVVLAADHGEWFRSKGRQHGRVTPDVTHIPLIVQAEGWPQTRYPGVASLVDVMPTILDLTQTPAPSGLDGLALRRQLDEKSERSVVLAETWSLNRNGALSLDLVAAIDTEFSLQVDRRKNAWSLFRVTPGTIRDENLLGSIERGELEHALNTFLEANSQLKLAD
jgi:arylsulfatase A-like enzyme